ncbi:MAG: LPS-assembly protein LptD [Hyphomicrobiales bacterium]|nr:LPS-assembly protein LptD [Hyphomicrobiales bacterium]
MTRPASDRWTPLRRRPLWRAAGLGGLLAVVVAASLVDLRPAIGQGGGQGLITFPKRQGQSGRGGMNIGMPRPPQPEAGAEQMLVRANEINYDHTNDRVAAVGNVQIYYSGATLEADRVIYDQKTKRLHAEGNVKLSEANGRVTYGEIINLSDDLRDGFVDSLRLETPEQTRMAASRADRTGGNITVLQAGVYTACEACADDPRKPPKWQVKAARIIHHQGEQTIYFEDARLEFFGVPLAYVPFFSAPDPTAKRKTGVLIPTWSTNSRFGVAVTVPYYIALAPNYDFTFTPKLTSRQGPLLQGEWRHRLMNGAYTVRASGIFQLDKDAYAGTPGQREWRGDINSTGQFRINDRWVYGWDGTIISDKSYYQDYGFYRFASTDLLRSTPDYVASQAYLQGRGERSFFDLRAIYFYGFTSADDQKQIPIVHPVANHEYVFGTPVLGGETSIRSNLTSLSRQSPAFEAITAAAATGQLCTLTSADSQARTAANCIMRGTPTAYTRASTDLQWRRTIVDSYGQMFTPFMSARADAASVDISPAPGVSNFVMPGQTEFARFMPTAGIEYRFPFISVQSWGTQTIAPIAQVMLRPNETRIGSLPNEDSQSFVFDASNLFRHNKFAGWDRVEGGSRANVGAEYTAQFHQGGYLNVMVGQSYHLFGQNSFAVASPTNTGLDSGLDKARSDYVARVTYQPNAQLSLSSRFRLDEGDFTLQRSEYEAAFNFERWSTSIMYGYYAAQPAIGFLDSREGVVSTARFKVSPNWQTFGGVRYDLKSNQVNETQIGMGYVDDCLILALNYITEYRYSTTDAHNHTVMLQFSLRTLGGTSARQGLGNLSNLPGSSR